MRTSQVRVNNILTRSSGYLGGVVSHSLQPYQGCSFGNSLCGIGCYVQHNRYLMRGRSWGEFLEVRLNAADSYTRSYRRERNWAHRTRGRFSVFMSSVTDPFLPQEFLYGITAQVLRRMVDDPLDELILQTHSPAIVRYLSLISELAKRLDLRVHISIETDHERIPGLPPPAASVEARVAAARTLRKAGIFTVVTVAPLLPILDPEKFFQTLSEVADAVVIDHFIGGDGSATGWRTRRTKLPAAIASIDPTANSLEYRRRVVDEARRHLPGRVGVAEAGFAGHYA